MSKLLQGLLVLPHLLPAVRQTELRRRVVGFRFDDAVEERDRADVPPLPERRGRVEEQGARGRRGVLGAAHGRDKRFAGRRRQNRGLPVRRRRHRVAEAGPRRRVEFPRLRDQLPPVRFRPGHGLPPLRLGEQDHQFPEVAGQADALLGGQPAHVRARPPVRVGRQPVPGEQLSGALRPPARWARASSRSTRSSRVEWRASRAARARPTASVRASASVRL
ncbi:hypothetical protein FTUN_1420 [Frigoriglobus tundricola]|uniref:Uncharacterized protein n=1 Tax=Frigoriglobus tundricola TaxID=2774151 RepID=A0A6M5YKU6_9BACT|nr:hypothetical protein FTUN_1420 [Frigoriglobus tundricola]